MNKTVYRIMVLSIAVILLATGTYIGLKISDKVIPPDDVTTPTIQDENTTTTSPVVSVYKPQEQDIEVIYEDYYTNCKDTITNKNIEYGTTKEKIKANVDKDYKLTKETDNSLTFRREINSNCPNHFELKIVDGYIMIYQIISENVYSIYKNTEIPVSNVREELVNELEKGIKVNSVDELNSYIEDIES